MKVKISLGITILIYIILLLNSDYSEVIGYLCAIDFVAMFTLFVLIFKDQPKK